jgi:hypothetical protein
MKTETKIYIVESLTNVYVDSYNEGEGDFCNCYEVRSEQQTKTPLEAIKLHFENSLFYTFYFNLSDTDENKKTLYYSNLVNVDNEEVEEKTHTFKQWKKGKINLYVANHVINVIEYKLTEIF